MPGPRQYTSLAFTEALLEAGIAGSIGSVGDALDNALRESTIGLFKTELIDRQRSWTGRNEVERETAAWAHWFNTERLHSAIGYRPPVEVEELTVTPRPPRTSQWPEPSVRQTQDGSAGPAGHAPRGRPNRGARYRPAHRKDAP